MAVTVGSQRHQPPSMPRQPLPPLPEVLHRPLNEEPELGRVIRLHQMRDLVDDDVVDDARRQEDRPSRATANEERAG